MKKLLKLAAAFAALALMFGFASCSDGDEEDPPATYNITYMDGETAMTELTPATYTEGTEATLPTPAAKAGFRFEGWYATGDFSGDKVTAIAATDTGDKTFYAKWTAVATYTITYMNGETPLTGLTPAMYTEGTETTLSATPTKEGYKFAGWYAESALTTKVEKIAATETGDKTFYAKWDALYTVVHVDGSAVDGLENLTLAELEVKAQQMGLEENTHYTIDEANRKIHLTPAGEDKVEETPLPATYTITYMDGDKTLTGLEPATYTEGTEKILPTPTAKDGYTFDGWYAESTLTTKVEKIAATDTGDKTFYAKWTANTPPADPLKQSGTFSEDITKLDFATSTEGLTDTITDTTKNGKYKINNGTTLASGYFKIVQSEKSSTTYYTDKARTQINAVELDKQGNNSYIEFTVTGSAEVTVSAKSTGGENTSYVEIVAENEEGTFETATAVQGTASATEIKKTCPAGTYWIVVVTDSSRKSLARIDSITAVQTVN